VGECFFSYQLTWVIPDKIQRAVKQLCVCVCVCNETNGVYKRNYSFRMDTVEMVFKVISIEILANDIIQNLHN